MTDTDDTAKGKSDRAQPRPLTLLIACGVVFGAALLIITGVVAGYLREQTLASSEAGLLRLDAVLVEMAGRSLSDVEAALTDVAGRIPFPDISTPDEIANHMREPGVVEHLDHRVQASSEIAGMAFIGAQGEVIRSAGDWPPAEDNVLTRDYFATLRAQPGLDFYIGAPYPAGRDGALVIPVAHKLRSADSRFAGVAVATLPVSDFEGLYRSVPLDDDSAISLIRRDGTVLAQYPHLVQSGDLPASAPVLAALAARTSGILDEDRDDARQGYIDAVKPVGDYPVSVVVSTSRARALVGWSRQADMFVAFAFCGVAAIGLMVVLLGRQIQTHNALAAIRAEKIEAEHAKLVAEAELLRKERLSVLGQFTATVAIELRNPLAAIRNTLFTMREMATSSGLVLDRPIARIQRSIARCDRSIGDLLEYIRTPELSRVSVSFDEWLRDVLVVHGLPPAVMLVEEYAAGDAIVRIDADRIRHVVINLVDNASQALGEKVPGDGPLRISVRSAVVDGALELSVADTGPGIPPENMARIFEPLFSTKSFGAGLGLSTVKQIVVQHGGTIEIASELGVGTTVSIRLPIEQALKVAA